MQYKNILTSGRCTGLAMYRHLKSPNLVKLTLYGGATHSPLKGKAFKRLSETFLANCRCALLRLFIFYEGRLSRLVALCQTVCVCSEGVSVCSEGVRKRASALKGTRIDPDN